MLFYTNGVTVWDSSNTVRANGAADGLLGNPSSTQSSIIVPVPNNNLEYYIFTIDGSSHTYPPFNHFNGIRINVSSWIFTPLTDHMMMPLLALPNTSGSC